ncbi:hypothetical protein [Pseudomonas syringae]|uniref:hypothetical protein n=1 Tax=Pseudomonas syringae TaxID=317 RepID=UPI0018E6448B|nr:hypothetical protein [Pseudomonas syringae]MBI6740394.1 hypothetical protein [Pseudomonas syringae]MBI6745959.1 hypothetical protein [Pseudomonas syringae]MBI6760374.1 hypothetical protein [Pseudomonas syringae]MBI6807123.1 hypothetical protein [Pseudomonas syringae]MBI6829477.1 hypothetical protein [Pseudomonas syringae]
MDNKPTEAQVGLLWHTLGLRPECRDSRTVYRNRFLAGPGHSDMTDLEALVTLGLMGSRKPPAFCDQSEILYFATKEGERFAIAEMPPAPPAPKRTNFDAYLDESECYDSFAHFLGIRMPWYQERGERGKREYRMVRYRRNINRFHSAEYLLLCEPVEVAGEWCLDKKEAKASYKAALKAVPRPRRREYGEGF